MKPFSLSKLCFLLILIGFIFAACPSPYMNSYYIQQQNQSISDDIIPEPDPNPDWNDDEGSALPPLPSGTVNAFWVILPDGKIIEPEGGNSVHTQLAGKLGGEDASYTGYMYPTVKFNDWKFISSFSSTNVPQMEYSGTVQWIEDNGQQKYEGANSFAGSYTISNMVYYRYNGKNPFGLYKDEKYPVYAADGNPTGEKEALMKRFIFYRFTGKVPVAGGLNNHIIAVDTYSKLVFMYAKPTGFSGLGVPTGWEPIDRASGGVTAADGRKYRFYEYDPSGYVTEDGVFHMSDTYKNNLAAGNYIPAFTGKSPYLGCGGSVESPLGTLTVKAKYLKNDSIPEAGFWAGGDPEFVWDVRSRAYGGEEIPSWNSVAKQTENFNFQIPKNTVHIFTTDAGKKETESKQDYALSGAGPHMLELDSLIVEMNGETSINEIINKPVTKYEAPIIYLKYDTAAKAWKIAPDSTNGVYTNGPVAFDTDFSLSNGEVKEFCITLPGGKKNKNGTMELCYELTWHAHK